MHSSCPECGSDIASEAYREGDNLVGLIIQNKYELVEYIGEGAMGWIYRGIHRELKNSVAVKLMKPQADKNDIWDKRFRREAETAALLNHPNILSILDFGKTPGGLLYITSEFVRGITLDQFLEDHESMPFVRLLKIFNQILSAMEEAHILQVVHRDLKPNNIMITPLRSGDDQVKVLDFGIAKVEGTSSQSRLTLLGQVMGTPGYMSPEQIRGEEATFTCDIYACGAILYRMLTGREIFTSHSPMEVLSLQIS